MKKLELGGIIQNYYIKNNNSSDYSFYKISKYGKKIITSLMQSYNEYYEVILRKSDGLEEKAPEYLKSRIIDAGCGNWALPNEKTLGWIHIFSMDVFKLEIIFSLNLKLTDFYNIDFQKNNSTSSYMLNVYEGNLNFLSFEFKSEIPEGDNPINLETVNIIAYDKELNELSRIDLMIEIIKPIVKLDVVNQKISENRGYFEIKLSIVRGVFIEIEDLNVEIRDENNNPILIKTTQKDPMDYLQNLPPGIKMENILGGFEINNIGTFKFHFKISYLDINKNRYYSKTKIIELKNEEQFEGNLNYTYGDYEGEVAIA